MGASEWNYFVPYQSDINQALQTLRQEEFEQHGNDYRNTPYWEGMTLEEFLPPEPVDDDERAEYAATLRHLQSLPEPTTIEELQEWNSPDGTHSILDINGVSDTPKFGTVSPLTPDQLLTLFGTTQPTRTMVRQAGNRYGDLRKRWEGLFIIVYRDGRPDEIFFTGFSGD